MGVLVGYGTKSHRKGKERKKEVILQLSEFTSEAVANIENDGACVCWVVNIVKQCGIKIAPCAEPEDVLMSSVSLSFVCLSPNFP